MITDMKVVVKNYLRRDEIMENFAHAMGGSIHTASAFISSVTTAVGQDPMLQACSLESIYASALRAASLQLYVDPSMGQAYLVPYGNICTLIVGYRGLIQLAWRTNRYYLLNASVIYAGETWEVDRLTGVLYHDKTTRTSRDIVAHMAYFKFAQKYGGTEKWLVMTVPQIHAHKERYAKGYNNPKSAWVTHTQQMEKKTVLRRLLLEWGYLNPADSVLLHTEETDTIEQDYPEIDATILEEIAEDANNPPQQTAEESIQDLGY